MKSIEDSQRIDNMTYSTFQYAGSLSMRLVSEEGKNAGHVYYESRTRQSIRTRECEV